MHFSQIYGCVCSILVLECVWAAPVAEKLNPAMKKRSLSEPVLDQEKQLKSLLTIAGNNIPMSNVAVQKNHVAHVKAVNGQEVKHEAIEEKVIDTQTGDVVSDVLQDVTENDDPGSVPQTVMKTKIDIPAEGLHKTIIQNAQKSEVDESLALSPTDVAQYLLETGEFQNFYSAIQDLISSNVMTQEEAEVYQQEVMNEYQRLLAEIDAFQAEEAQQQAEAFPVYYPPPFPGQIPQKRSDLYDYLGGYLPEELAPQNQQSIEEALYNNENSMDEAIDSLLEAWWTQAYEAGDSRAQALVDYLYNIVSKDDDLDDMGQIKEIVGKMLARAVMNDESELQPELLENIIESVKSQESEGSDEPIEVPEQSISEEELEEDASNDETEESQDDTVESKEVEEVVPPAELTEDKTAKM